MKLRRSDGILIGVIALLAALPTLVQSNIPWLGLGQPTAPVAVLEEVKLENVQMARLAADQMAQSDIFDAPHPFNALVVQWSAEDTGVTDPDSNVAVEESASLFTLDLHSFVFMEVRTGQDGTWSDWRPIQISGDLTQEGETFVTSDMIFVDGGSSTHEQVQIRSNIAEVIPDVRLTYIDSTEGPTTDEMVNQMNENWLDARSSGAFLDTEALLANPKPRVISRDVWCTNELCRPNEGDSGNNCVNNDPLNYVNVTHLVVHHTVSSNSTTDWAPVVRAIWNFHAFGRCWGDIGYNYLIDPYGNIYEGHRGGDNIAGTHAGHINADSMGVSLLGTFTEPGPPHYGIKPPPAMVNSLVDILAWKADQKQIDPWDSSWAGSLGSGRPNLMGHRDAHGTTTCPGEQAHDMLPALRQRVAERLDFVQDRIYFDELGNNFSRNNANWYTGKYSCGFNDHAWFTFSTSNFNESTNVGEWTLEVPQDGFYVVDAMVPFCNTENRETGSARYLLKHGGGTADLTINQNNHLGQWAKLGSFEFKAGQTYTLRLTDFTRDDGFGVWFDAIRLTPAAGDDLPTPKFSLSTPDNNAWFKNQTVNFEWGVDNFYGPDDVKLTLSSSADMRSVIHAQTFEAGTTAASVALGRDYPAIYWQIEGLGSNGGASEVRRLGVDTSPPSTNVSAVLKQVDGPYTLALYGSDGDGSGINHYTIDFRRAGSGNPWIRLQDVATSNAVPFLSAGGNVYEFRVRGIDNLGNVEAFKDAPTGSTANAIVVRPQVYLPVIGKK